jgi:hypothetical protein
MAYQVPERQRAAGSSGMLGLTVPNKLLAIADEVIE